MPQTKVQKSEESAASENKLSSSEKLYRFLINLQRYAWDFLGVFCLALGLMTLLALFFPASARGILSWWAGVLQLWFGWGSLWIVIFTGSLGVLLLRRKYQPAQDRFPWQRILMLELAAFASLALLAVIGGSSFERAEAGMDGGRIGWGLALLLNLPFQSYGTFSAWWVGTIAALVMVWGLSAGLGWLPLMVSWANRQVKQEYAPLAVDEMHAGVSEFPVNEVDAERSQSATQQKKRNPLPPQFRKNFRVQNENQEKPARSIVRDERLPSLDLLVNEPFNRPDERNINLTAGLIEKTLSEFGIPARVVGFRVGPTVTQFAVEPGYVEKEKSASEGDAVARQKVRVAQISALGKDLALALSAERLRIEAPVPGRPYVGIEVPNLRSSIVRLRPILEAEAFHKKPAPLNLVLGRDVSGNPVVADLSAMPHLLIAGTTGSGKSVSIAAFTTCLVVNNTPEDLRLVMVDPKMVELVRFNGLPHLFGKVETDLERILAVLRWSVSEMERRYKVLESSRSRNIDTHNRKIRRKKGEQPLPRIVIMIDELADLMMSAPDQTEHNLVRLAQMARAVGMHLVVATQRPSTEVVTGLIKANFPARISFAVASSVDSRVILDTVGAEALLGKGDMLFLPPEASGPIRVQGVMISDPEVERVITFWQKSYEEALESEQAPWDEMIEKEQTLADRDNLVEQAIEIVRNAQRASASMLQRRLRIGYPRAARLMDELEELGVIGSAVSGGRDREVLIDRDDGGDD